MDGRGRQCRDAKGETLISLAMRRHKQEKQGKNKNAECTEKGRVSHPIHTDSDDTTLAYKFLPMQTSLFIWKKEKCSEFCWLRHQ